MWDGHKYVQMYILISLKIIVKKGKTTVKYKQVLGNLSPEVQKTNKKRTHSLRGLVFNFILSWEDRVNEIT